MPSDRIENREQLQTLLRDLFQFDATELDFGVYRILNQRRDRIERFVEEDLLDAVEEGLEALATSQREDIQEQIGDLQESIRVEFDEDAIAPDGSLTPPYDSIGHEMLGRYRALRDRLDTVEVAEETEARIFNDLYRFFSRYYDDGDFHTKRRISSKDSKYYVPYNGEETYFHWANRDQYYVKTSEHFTDYRFEAGDVSVEFQLEDADVPQDNVKGDGRYFVLGRGDPVSFDTDERKLTVTFQYRQITESEAEDIVEGYNEATDDDRSSFAHMTPDMRCDALQRWILDRVEDPTVERALTTAASENRDDPPSRLKRHLRRYVSENTMDYFVHKNLSGFLRGELEFFLQNEVLEVDGLINAEESVPPNVLRARTVKLIAERIITFLAQIEDFQKRLVEKKKFVVQTDYMATLDQVPDDLYDDILENDEQLEQWRDVYNTDSWDTDLKWQGEFDQTFLNNHPSVMIDTALFDDVFKLKLLSAFEDIEEAIDGVLVNSENFQALNLLMEKYRNEVDCTYIDPPYNTGGRDFLYKDNYQHSSWLSMMSDRVRLSKGLLGKEGSIFTNIDDNEQGNLHQLMTEIYGKQNFVANIIWQKKYAPQNDATWFSDDHDYIPVWAKDKSAWRPEKLPRTEKQNQAYKNRDDDPRGPWRADNYVSNKSKDERPNTYYSITNPNTGEEIWPDEDAVWRYTQEQHVKNKEENRVWWGKDGNNSVPAYKRFLSEVGGLVPRTFWDWEKAGHNQDAVRELQSLFGSNPFSSPKPPKLMKRILRIAPGDVVLDYFAGSGTTAQAVMELNREDDQHKKTYLMVEMGDYFDTVLRPRIQKTAFSKEWSEGVPESRNGQTHLVKYHRLESYEDALNNITLSESSGPLQEFLEGEVEDYISGYVLDFESKDSPSLLPEGAFDEPFDFELEIEQNGTSREPTSVDLVETFHYLIGAHVRQYFQESYQDRQYVVTECEVETESATEQVLTVWRKTEGLDLEAEAEWFDDEFDAASYDRVYVNGESFIAQSEPLAITFRERMEAPPDVA